jgi:hypothetical protein
MTKKSFLFPLFSLALLAAFTPRTAQATTTTITIGSLSQAPFQLFITEPANDTTPEDSLNLTITGGTWVAPFTVEVTESSRADEPAGTPSDVLTFFNEGSSARVCGQSFPVAATVAPCPVIANNIFHGTDGGGGGSFGTAVPAMVEFQTSAGAKIELLLSACGGGGSCGNASLSDAIRIARPTATPEPATLQLLGTGLSTIGLLARRRRKAA